MRIPITIFATAILCAAAAWAQNTPSSVLQSAPSTATSDKLKPQPPVSGVEMLSDTEGVDFKDYLVRWRRITEANWQPPILKKPNAPTPLKGTVAIRFKILPSGKIMDGGIVLDERSGQTPLDKAAWDAISGSAYPPLPEAFHGPYLELRAHFIYEDHTAK